MAEGLAKPESSLASVLEKLFRPKPATLTTEAEISRGTYGSLYCGDYNGKGVSIKNLGGVFLHHYKHKEQVTIEATLLQFKKDLRVLKSLSHPYLIEIHGTFCDVPHEELLLVAEKSKEDLKSYLSRHVGRLKGQEQIVITLQIATGLRYLHLFQPEVPFHDLSDRNILMCDGIAKIFHYGQHQIRPKTADKLQHLLPYLPPETQGDDPRYTSKGDVFSLGVIILQIATQKPPILAPLSEGQNERPTEMERRKGDLGLLAKDGNPFKHICSMCLVDDPDSRPNIITLHNQLSVIAEGGNRMFRAELLTQGKHTLLSSPLPDIPKSSAFACGLYLSGKVYICGGRSENAESARYIYVYSFADNSWSTLPAAPQIYGQAVVALGLITLIGGCTADQWKVTDNIVCWIPKDQTWKEVLPSMPTKRVRPAVINNKEILIVAGGLGVDLETTLDSVDVLNLVDQKWYSLPSLKIPKPLSCAHLIDCGEEIQLLGGIDQTKEGNLLSWKLKWSEIQLHAAKKGKKRTPADWIPAKDTPLRFATYISAGSNPLSVGGTKNDRHTTSQIYAFTPQKDKWSQVGRLSQPRAHACVVPLSNTALFVVGGCVNPKNVEETLLTSVEFLYL